MASSTDFRFNSDLLLFFGAPDVACASEMSPRGSRHRSFTKLTWTKRRILDALQDTLRNSLRVKGESAVLDDTRLSGETRGEPGLWLTVPIMLWLESKEGQRKKLFASRGTYDDMMCTIPILGSQGQTRDDVSCRD